MNDPALNNKDAAEYLGYKPKTLEVSRFSKKLGGVPAPEHFKIGEKTVRYRQSVLDEWLAQFKRSA